MGFLNPLLLFGLAAVSVPIIIHLLNRRKFQKVVWAAMRFIQTSVERNQRRMRVEDMILLALRCLLLALLAFALARPAFKNAGSDLFGESKVTDVVILDNSQSMGMSDGTMTRFEKARKAAEQALATMPAGSATAVLLASDIVNGVIPEPTFDFNLARKAIREAPLTDRATDLLPVVQRALDTLKQRIGVRKELYLITDGQLAGWKQMGEIEKLLENSQRDVRSHIVLVSEHEERNLAVTDLRNASGLTPINQPIRFEARVSNLGREEVRNMRVSLSADNEPPSDEFTIDSLPPGGSKSVSLFAKLRTEGFHSIVARIPEDRLSADDKRTLAVRAIKEVRVLLVDGDPGEEPRDSETFFLRHALIPVPPSEQPNYFIKVVRLTAPEIASARLDDFDAVVLANVADFSDAVAKNMEQFVRRGGGLVFFSGGRINPAFYNEQLSAKYHLLPATVGPARGNAEQDAEYFTLQDRDLAHGIVSIWNDPNAGTLSSVRFYRAHDLIPVAYKQPAPNEKSKSAQFDEAGAPQTVVKFSHGTPAIIEHTYGLGRIVMFASTADTAWNDLPVRPAFVPLIHRMLGALVQRQDEGLNVRVGQKFVRRVASELLDKEARVFKPRQTDALLEQRRIEMVNGWPMLQYDQTDLSGMYEIAIGENRGAVRFAAQSDAAESSLDELSGEQKKLLSTVAHVVDWAPNVSLKDQVQRERNGAEFWLPIVIIAMLIAGAETFLGQWFSRAK
jgi:SAM-dependent methyltransferase